MTYRDKHSAYKTNSHMVSKTKQVVMLYEGAIKWIQQAKAAIEDNRIEDRYNSLVRACDIITGLQVCLDFKKAEKVSQILYDFYAGIDMRLMSIHNSNDAAICDLCIIQLKTMKEAWEEIDAQQFAQRAEQSPEIPISSSQNLDLSEKSISNALGNAAMESLSVSV